MAFRILLKTVCVRRSSSPSPNPTSDTKEKRHQKLSMLVQTLSVLEKAGEASGVPYLKGALALALEVAQAVEGYRSNNEDLEQLALDCGTLMKDIANQLQVGGGLSENMEMLVEDLHGTLEKVQKTAKNIIDNDSRARRFFAQKDTSRKLGQLSKDVVNAQFRFMTLVTIANAQNQEQAQDVIYDHSSIVLGSCYASGDNWIAFNGKLQQTEELVIVKRYRTEDIFTRKAMHEADIKAFKKNWSATSENYVICSCLPGIPISSSIWAEVAQELTSHILSSEELKDLTNALAFTVGATDSSSFDISKVHLNGSGNVVVVNLDPTLVVKGAKDDMPYWRSWQEICIQLLAGDPLYEPNPSIEYDMDPASHRRLEYLRPILGHIHYGGARFKETSIEMAFKSEGLVLAQAYQDLHASVHNPLAPADARVLQAMWHRGRSRELHYVAHFHEPLDIDIGDIGYITGDPPEFVQLVNVRSRIADKIALSLPPKKIKPLRPIPRNKWFTTIVAGINRHEFRFPASGVVDLLDWRSERPRLDRDFLLRRINVPGEKGLVVECSTAWKALSECATDLASKHTERSITASNLILVVYLKQHNGYATFRLNKKVTADQWRDIWAKDGIDPPPTSIYFYESPPGGPNGVWGYFSLSPTPGTPYPKWTPDRDDAGEAWGWTFQSEDWTVEISKPNIKQYIRYVQL
ncbi:hypothetical protein DFH06DRAFT_1480186 [Mycena polygramma]|nr:hypothetical protein DFH06DRAFT_1480186 [Mycena polygramma]